MSKVLVSLVEPRVAPEDRQWETGIAIEGGWARPFIVERSWSGPAGNYIEQWSLRHADGEVVYQSAPRYIRVTGMQSKSHYSDRVGSIALETGEYVLVLSIDGLFMGSSQVVGRAPAGAVA